MGMTVKPALRIIMRCNCDGAYQACITAPGPELGAEELAANITAVAIINDNDHYI